MSHPESQGVKAREIQASWLYFIPWEDYGANPSVSQVQEHEEGEGDWEKPARICQVQIVYDQPNCLLQYNDWICG